MTEAQGEWRGWADWLGVVSVWNRTTLLAFLEDLRPHLGRLEESELYAIISQSGAMPALRAAFDKERPGRLIRDLKENDGREVEEALLNTSEEDIEEAILSGEETTEEEFLGILAEEDVPPEEEHPGPSGAEEAEQGLPGLVTPEGLRAVDALAEMHYGLDDETAEFLVRNRVAALWTAHITHGPGPVDEALSGEGGHYFGLIRSRFREELSAVLSLPVPAGWSFRPPDVGSHEPPVQPNLMQRRTAYEVLTRKRVGNFSGVGAGKTLSAILASRVADRRHTLIITNKATMKGWKDEIENAYPDSVVHTVGEGFPAAPPKRGEHHYTLVNYDRFQLPNRGTLVQRLADSGVDFVVFDEVQLVKQRDQNASKRREAAEGLTSLLSERHGDDLRVLGMSATPVINNLKEAQKLLEIIVGRSFAELNTQATVANALAVHRACMVYGFRYRPPYEAETALHTPVANGDDLLEDLRLAEGILGVEQTLLGAKLEAARGYIRPGTIVYTHYVEGMLGPIRRFVERMGYRAGFYTGEDKTGLEDFKAGRVDVLIGSKPVGTGLDGLQKVSDRIVVVCPPWTSAEFEQLEGRIRRQGSAFKSVAMVIPQVVLEHEGEEWSWDKRRWGAIEYKRTLSDCATDGQIPETVSLSPQKLLSQSREALEEWIRRVREEDPVTSEIRPELRVPLPEDTVRRLVVKRGDFSVLNNRWSTSNSQTIHERLKEEPEEWYLYHTLYREHREGWPELPAEVIAGDLKGRPDLKVGDFGCGEMLLKEALGDDHRVVGLDHVAIDERVMACDIASTPLEDDSLGAAVFSLSLMGRNWREYLAEAHRTLQPFGLLFVAEPAKRWEEGKLEAAVEEAGFELLPARRRGGFLYLRAVKKG